MKKFTTSSPTAVVPQPRIFKIMVRNDAHEVGIVVAYPTIENPDEANVKGQIKVFKNETDKLRFLANAKRQGFRNFENTRGKVDVETMVLAELARRQHIEKKEKEQESHKTLR